MLKLAKRKKWT